MNQINQLSNFSKQFGISKNRLQEISSLSKIASEILNKMSSLGREKYYSLDKSKLYLNDLPQYSFLASEPKLIIDKQSIKQAIFNDNYFFGACIKSFNKKIHLSLDNDLNGTLGYTKIQDDLYFINIDKKTNLVSTRLFLLLELAHILLHYSPDRSYYNDIIAFHGSVNQSSINLASEVEAAFFCISDFISEYRTNIPLLLSDLLPNITETIFFQRIWHSIFEFFIVDSVIVAPSLEEIDLRIRPAIVTVTSEFLQYLEKNPSLIYEIDPWKFEELMSEIFSGIGYSIETTKRTRDGGIDIIATKSLDTIPLRFLIQVKRYKNRKVDVSLVRELYGLKHHIDASKAIIATTSSFTQPAQQFQSAHKWELDLKDLDDIRHWIRQYYMNTK
jgi:hypothetical protein